MTDERVIITPAEAESLLKEGADDIHNLMQRGMLFVGMDWSRESVIKAFKEAKQIEIGGDTCKGMKHPIVVWNTEKSFSFFEADMEKVEAFEDARIRHKQFAETGQLP
jgi:hypothetical protein